MDNTEHAASPPAVVAGATGISVDLIALRSCTFEDHYFESLFKDSPNPEPEDDQVDIEADVRLWFSTNERTALVQLILKAQPRTQPSWSAVVDIVGQYSASDSSVMPLAEFARGNGIAYLVPYARERLASLTSASVFETYNLPPLNVSKIWEMARVAQERSSAPKTPPSSG